jgi:hypothetical protein
MAERTRSPVVHVPGTSEERGARSAGE